jgi:hypothetical protein
VGEPLLAVPVALTAEQYLQTVLDRPRGFAAHTRRKQLRQCRIGPIETGFAAIRFDEYLESVAQQYGFDEWSRPASTWQVPIQPVSLARLVVVPGWTAADMSLAPADADAVTIRTRQFWRSPDGTTTEIDLYVSKDASEARRWAVVLLGRFTVTTLDRVSAPFSGEAAFRTRNGTAVIETYQNTVRLVREFRDGSDLASAAGTFSSALQQTLTAASRPA